VKPKAIIVFVPFLFRLDCLKFGRVGLSEVRVSKL